MTIKTRLPYPNNPKADAYGTTSQQAAFFREILRRSRTLPGVEEAGVGDLGAIPLGHDRNNQNPPVPLSEGRDAQSNDTHLVDESIVTPEYFHLLGITLRRGRLFSNFDNEKAPSVAVINETMAQTYWPNEDPVGKHLKPSLRAKFLDNSRRHRRRYRSESLGGGTIPEVYTSLYQRGAHHLAIFLRGHLTRRRFQTKCAQVQDVDPTLPSSAHKHSTKRSPHL